MEKVNLLSKQKSQPASPRDDALNLRVSTLESPRVQFAIQEGSTPLGPASRSSRFAGMTNNS